MVLTVAIEKARRQTATRENREAQARAELRLEELLKVDGIADEYAEVDRRGDLAIETQFAKLYQLVDTEHEREAVVAAFMVWQADEAEEERIVRGSVEEAGSVMRRNNGVWLEGQPAQLDEPDRTPRWIARKDAQGLPAKDTTRSAAR